MMRRNVKGAGTAAALTHTHSDETCDLLMVTVAGPLDPEAGYLAAAPSRGLCYHVITVSARHDWPSGSESPCS